MSATCDASVQEPEFVRIVYELHALVDRIGRTRQTVSYINESLLGGLAKCPTDCVQPDDKPTKNPFVVDCSNLLTMLREHVDELESATDRLLKQIGE